MNRSKLVTAGLILFLVIIIWLIMQPKNQKGLLVTSLSPSLTPVSTPKQYKFDSSTDLKKELESINPQVLDSDFE